MTPMPIKPRQPIEPEWQRPKARPGVVTSTVWLDYATAAGVTANADPVLPVLGGGRRKNATLVDLLNTAFNQHVDRVVVCGAFPADGRSWLLPQAGQSAEDFLPGWRAENPHLEGDITGRFTHEATGRKLELRTTKAWFPTYPLTPQQAQWSTLELARIVAAGAKWQGWPLLENPGATGRNLWKALAPKSYGMERLDPEIGRFIQATSPQGRNEHFVEGPSRCDCGDCLPLIPAGTQIDGFCYVDGRFMYAGVVTGELGAAPAHWLNAHDAEQLWNSDHYHPARYNVRFTVPAFWEGPGLLGVKRDANDPESGWHWPNRPGATYETWVDVAELQLAEEWGWSDTPFEILEGIKLTKTNSLQPFTRAIFRMLDAVDEQWGDKPAAAQVLSSALKQMYRVTIGSFSARAPLTTITTQDPEQIPPSVEHFETLRDPDTGKITGYAYKVATHSNDPDTWHPEIAARVWALSRVRTLWTPIADPVHGAGKEKRGALEIPMGQLIGMQTDAIYTTTIPEWTLPVGTTTPDGHSIGGDDGKNGRLRLKGWLPGPLEAPATRADRQLLSSQADSLGLSETPYA